MEVQESESIASYDKIHYVGIPYPETHPNRLATIAMVFGMQPPSVTHCRVLELGCGSGENLISAAYGLPDSHFLGIDLSVNEVALANKAINDLQLKNIEVRHGNIMEVKKDIGKFDYIIAHGVYSWVPDEVKKRVLSLCHELLNKNGVALISYNTYPGWHIHQIARDVMRYGSRDVKDTLAATKAGREFYTKVVAAISPKNPIYKDVMEDDYERTRQFSDEYLSHDTLGEINDPFYFYQFVEAAENAKLQYLGDAVFHSMIANNISVQAVELLKTVGPDIIETEQCLDFINNRLFRSTLLCHENIELIRGFDPEILRQFFFAAPLQWHEHSEDLLDDRKVSFQSINGPTLSTADPLAKILLSYLSMEWPRPVSFAEISGYLQRTLKSQSKDLPLQALQYLWRSYTIGLLKLYMHPLTVANRISEKPKVSALIRYQAAHKYQCLTSQLHEEIPLSALMYHLLPLLDGEHDHAALLDKMVELAKTKKIALQAKGAQITDGAQMRVALSNLLETTLQEWVRLGLLIS